MTAFLTKLTGGKVLVMGRAGMDLYPDPPGTKTADATRFLAGLGGSAGNIPAALARAGTSTALITCVSDDPIGRFTRSQLAQYGIDTTYLRTVGGEARNTLAIAESVLEGHETVVYRNGAADFQMDMSDVARVDFAQFAALVTAGTVLASQPSRDAALGAFAKAANSGCLTVFDIDYRPYSWPSPEVASAVLSQAGEAADIIVGNDDEFGFMAGGYDKGMDHARALAAKGKLVIYKMGHKGAITLFEGTEVLTPPYPVTALKPIGAGDAFLGTLLAALTMGQSLDTAVHRGAAAAAIVVSRVGCALNTPTPTEIDDFLASRS